MIPETGASACKAITFQVRLSAPRDHLKLSPQYYRPFEILQKIEFVTYKLQLSETYRIRPVFYVSQFKKYAPGKQRYLKELPTINAEGIMDVTTDKSLHERTIFNMERL